MESSLPKGVEKTLLVERIGNNDGVDRLKFKKAVEKTRQVEQIDNNDRKEFKKAVGKTRQVEPIGIDRVRRLIYKRRKNCIKKKTMELARLCDINACTICFAPDGKVETWPEKPSEVKALIKMYKDHPKKKSKDTEPLELVEEIDAAGKQSLKVKKSLSEFYDWLCELSRESLNIISNEVFSKLEVLNKRIELLKTTYEPKNKNVNATSIGFDAQSNSEGNPRSEHRQILRSDEPDIDGPSNIWPLNYYQSNVTFPTNDQHQQKIVQFGDGTFWTFTKFL